MQTLASLRREERRRALRYRRRGMRCRGMKLAPRPSTYYASFSRARGIASGRPLSGGKPRATELPASRTRTMTKKRTASSPHAADAFVFCSRSTTRHRLLCELSALSERSERNKSEGQRRSSSNEDLPSCPHDGCRVRRAVVARKWGSAARRQLTEDLTRGSPEEHCSSSENSPGKASIIPLLSSRPRESGGKSQLNT